MEFTVLDIQMMHIYHMNLKMVKLKIIEEKPKIVKNIIQYQ